MIVDAHAHVFARGLKPAADARYPPAYDATVEHYLGELDANGVAAGVLVQPSFLGTDNGHLLRALAGAPQRLRGVAVIDEGAGAAELERLHAGGIRGIRLNPYQRSGRPRLESAAWRSLLARIAELGWHVVVHDDGEALIDLLGRLRDCPAALNVRLERLVLERAARAPLFVKLSGPYRCDQAAAAAASAAAGPFSNSASRTKMPLASNRQRGPGTWTRIRLASAASAVAASAR